MVLKLVTLFFKNTLYKRHFLLGLVFCGVLCLCLTPQKTFARSKSPQTLDQAVHSILKRYGIKDHQVSIRIASLRSGNILYEKNPLKLMNPASNMKLLTTGAALYHLGPQFRFPTEFYSDTRLRRGHIRNLWIKGYGDPVLVTEEMEKIVDALYKKGLRVVEGSIYADDTYFDRKNKMTYQYSKKTEAHEVVTGALSFNFNSLHFLLSPAKKIGDQPLLTLKPPTSFVEIVNEAETSARRSRLKIESEVEFDSTRRLRVRGRLPRRYRQFSMRKVIRDPALYTGTILKDFLEARGIEVKGRVKRRKVPSSASVIYQYDSPPLNEILQGLNKFSNNFTAEQIVKVMGAKKYGPPGSLKKGSKVMENYLLHTGIPPGSYKIVNGSGLSKDNRLSAAQIVRVLETSYRYHFANDFISSLSISRVDGTLKDRFRKTPLKGLIWAKTGSLAFINTLSGYLMINKVPIAFSILMNDFSTSLKSVQRVQEKILMAVYKRAARLPL